MSNNCFIYNIKVNILLLFTEIANNNNNNNNNISIVLVYAH